MNDYEEIFSLVKKLILEKKTEKDILLFLHNKNVSLHSCIVVFSDAYDIPTTEAIEEISKYEIWEIERRNDWKDEFLKIVNDSSSTEDNTNGQFMEK